MGCRHNTESVMDTVIRLKTKPECEIWELRKRGVKTEKIRIKEIQEWEISKCLIKSEDSRYKRLVPKLEIPKFRSTET